MAAQNTLNFLLVGALVACAMSSPIAAQSNSTLTKKVMARSTAIAGISGYDKPPKDLLDAMHEPSPPVPEVSPTQESLSMGPARSAAVPAKVNAVWVYSVSSLPNPVTDAPTRAALVQDSSASGANILYVSVYSSTPNSAGRYMYADSDIASLIQSAHGHGILVYATYGDTDWPTLGCSSSAFPMKRMAEVIAYNAANPSATLDGVMLDVEPGSSPDYIELFELYQCFQQQAQANGMGLSVAISAFWTDTVTYGQVTAPAYEQIVDLRLTNIVVMGYRNYAGTSDCTAGDGVVCLDEAVIAYANSVSQANTVLVGLDTDNPATDGSTAEETFYTLGQTAMNAVAQSVVRQFSAVNMTFGGLRSTITATRI